MVLLWLALIPQSREELGTLEQGSDRAQVCGGHPLVRRRRRGGRVRIGGQEVIFCRRRLVRTVEVREDNQDVEDPETFIEALKCSALKPDLFTFRQRLTDPRPKYPFYREPEEVAVLPVTSYRHWIEKQINKGARQAIARAERRGVEVRVVDFDDQLVDGIAAIYNETPIRQGRPFPHYRKIVEHVKQVNGTYVDCSEFLGAYCEGDLIGFMKLTYMENYVDTMGILSKIAHRDKSPTNALVAKAVERCALRGKRFLWYGEWSRGGLGAFKSHNGFQRFELPRYYIPLTVKGQIILKLRLHRDVISFLPERLVCWMIEARTRWYSRLSIVPPSYVLGLPVAVLGGW